MRKKVCTANQRAASKTISYLKSNHLERGGNNQFPSNNPSCAVPPQYIPAETEAGISMTGCKPDIPVIDVKKVTNMGGFTHEIVSSELAFKIAGSPAVRERMKKALAGLLDPS